MSGMSLKTTYYTPVKKLFLLFIAMLAFGLVATPDAEARRIKKLTRSAVADFIKETTDITKNHASDMDMSATIEYLDTHLHKNARFKTIMTYNIPGFPAQDTAISLSKEEFIEQIEKGEKALEDYENQIDIQDIQISSKGTNATVMTTGFETGMMPVQQDGETEYIPVEGSSECSQIIILNKGVIQMYNANCNTTIHFSEY